MNHWNYQDGVPYPMGATWDEANAGYNFCLYSKMATQLSLYFFNKASPQQAVFSYQLDPIRNKTGSLWHCFILETALNNGDSYAYRANGDNTIAGNRFDPSKLLQDPWAKAIFFPPAFSSNAAIQSGDNKGMAALSLLVKQDTDPIGFDTETRPVHFHDLVVYEMHVKGFTNHSSSGVTQAHSGTFSGIIEKIPYLRELGITAVELMPVHQFEPQAGDYWGYMTMNFFAPHHAYGSNTDAWALVNEFKSMVQALHDAGIEVILDVIYNHTVEGDEHGPMYSYKGIDNSSYYLLTPDLKSYNNDTGTGNVMRTAYKMVRKLVLDSLRYWAEEMHIDGFRFDLATIYTRNDDGSINTTNPPILEEISMDPVLSKVRLIAEPWDINSYQLGNSFPGATWAQWNGDYRDDLRQFVKGDANKVASLMTRVYGSTDLFADQPPYNGKPYQSVNFINCHDGFSLYDLLAYDFKHNTANGQNNTDGTDSNNSWNCGWEGDMNVPADIMALRKKQAKNFVTILMFSNGTPMFRMGDEFLQTQNGNNNPFNQDNATSWLDWARLAQFADIFLFFKTIIALRKAHPSICRGTFWGNDIQWFGVNGQSDLSYNSRTLAYYLSGSSLNDSDFYVIINAYWQPLSFAISIGNIGEWQLVIDTSLPSPADINGPGSLVPVNAENYLVQDRSVVVLTRKMIGQQN